MASSGRVKMMNSKKKAKENNDKTLSKGYLIVTLIIIAILTSSFFYAFAQAFVVQPQSSDCYQAKELQNGSTTSPSPAESQKCYQDYQQSLNNYHSTIFYITSIAALIAIIVILVFFANYGGIAWYINTGTILGALFAILTSTLTSYNSLARPLRPIILLVEIAIVVWVAYKRLRK